jgi:hypothetical protein
LALSLRRLKLGAIFVVFESITTCPSLPYFIHADPRYLPHYLRGDLNAVRRDNVVVAFRITLPPGSRGLVAGAIRCT